VLTLDEIRANLAAVNARIEAACRKAGRRREEVTLVAVSKTFPAEAVTNAIAAGATHIGENKVQEAREKKPLVQGSARWHLIGHLQSNKAKVVNRTCELVHSLDSESAARKLTVPALVEVNLAGEASKSGIAPESLPQLLELADVRGLMTMPPETADPQSSRPYFRHLRELARQHGLHELSMGTSQDYAVAAEEGATLVRVGSVLYRE
jgi:PLP dependent protein